MVIPSNGFTVLVTRLRNERRRTQGGFRYRTVGRYQCYMDGNLIDDANLRGASVEPRGPGNNQQTGVNRGLRIEAGTYQLGTHGFRGAEYHTFNYHNDSKPRPGVYVHDTGRRSAILIHRGTGFKASVGCLNLTGSISGVNDDISPSVSFRRMDALIAFMKNSIAGFPDRAGRRIRDARLVIENEP